MKYNFKQMFLVPFLVWGAVACGEDAPPANPGGPPGGPGALAAKQAVAQEAPPEEQQTTSEPEYFYDPFNKPDPFKSFLVELRESEAALEPEGPLARFDVTQLSLKGVVFGFGNNLAMIEDPDEIGYTVSVGTPVGKNNGRVVEIRRDCIVILERLIDYTGREITNEKQLCLPEDEGD